MNGSSWILLFLSLTSFVLSIESYRILCVFPFNSKSHYRMFGSLCKGLAKKGHRVDTISHFPSDKPIPNYVDIVNLNGTFERLDGSFTLDSVKAFKGVYDIATIYGGRYCPLMGHESMQEFIKNPPNDPPYDIMITEYLGFPCYFALANYLKIPVAAASSMLEPPYLDESIGNPLSTSFFPNFYIDNAVLDGFWDRLTNALSIFTNTLTFHYYTNDQTEVIRKYFGQNMPDVRECEKEISLVLVNTHFSFHGVRPLTPALIEVGGLHIEEEESELSENLLLELDRAKDGIVYFTLGTLTNIDSFPERIVLDIYESFRRISPVKVLMKVSNKDKLPSGLPDNVMTSTWLPQIPVLRHKNIRAFISHGGLNGILEALYFGVPVIGIPLICDQPRNINILVQKRMAIKLDYENLTRKRMDDALDAILNDPSYRRAAMYESARFKDRPMRPIDTANYWIEYIIRNGPRSLRSPEIDVPWLQRNLIDLYAFFIVIIVFTVYVFLILWKFLLRIIRRRSLSDRSKGKKKD